MADFFMRIFLDTANIDAIKAYKELVDGVTSNPAIMAKEGAEQNAQLKAMCEAVPTLPVSGEVIYANSVEQICQDARKLKEIAPNIIVKIPGNLLGLKCIKALKQEGMKLNVTGLMTFKQLALASLLGADYVSQFFCRAKDSGIDSATEINKAKEFIKSNGLSTQIIIGSLRKPKDVEEALLTAGDILTINPELLEESFTHLKTDLSIKEFEQRYEDRLHSRSV